MIHTGINRSYLSSVVEIAIELVFLHSLVIQVHCVLRMGFHCIRQVTKPTFINGPTIQTQPTYVINVPL